MTFSMKVEYEALGSHRWRYACEGWAVYESEWCRLKGGYPNTACRMFVALAANSGAALQ